MMQVVRVVVLAALLPALGDAVHMRRATDIVQANKTIDASLFSHSYLAAVDAALTVPEATRNRTAQLQVTAGLGFMALATRGAAELDVEQVARTIPLPEGTAQLLRHGHKMAAGANMWKADVDTKIVQKAIVNLNGMVFQAQIRLDAKNDECEEFKAKYTETLDQINGDLARLGEELGNTARAILVHLGGIDANILNNEQTKEELQEELLAYNEVRNADLIVLQERETNLAVSAFILVFSACPDAPSASSALLQAGGKSSNQLTSTSVETCVNATNGTQVRFEDHRLNKAASRLSDEAQDMLLRFISSEESLKGGRGRGIAEAAEKLEPMALCQHGVY
jgi:hypothetical protein